MDSSRGVRVADGGQTVELFFGVADLVFEEHRLEHEHLLGRANGDQVLLVAQHEGRDADLLRLEHRLQQQRVRAVGALALRREVVGLAKEDRVDLF